MEKSGGEDQQFGPSVQSPHGSRCHNPPSTTTCVTGTTTTSATRVGSVPLSRAPPQTDRYQHTAHKAPYPACSTATSDCATPASAPVKEGTRAVLVVHSQPPARRGSIPSSRPHFHPPRSTYRTSYIPPRVVLRHSAAVVRQRPQAKRKNEEDSGHFRAPRTLHLRDLRHCDGSRIGHRSGPRQTRLLCVWSLLLRRTRKEIRSAIPGEPTAIGEPKADRQREDCGLHRPRSHPRRSKQRSSGSRGTIFHRRTSSRLSASRSLHSLTFGWSMAGVSSSATPCGSRGQ